MRNKILFPVLAALLLSACAGMLPGGTDTVNRDYYSRKEDLARWAADLQPGMSKAEVFARLGRVEKDFRKLDREQVVNALFGGKAGVPPQFDSGDNLIGFLDSLEGYSLQYKNVSKKHGFTSPIRIRTDISGFDYGMILIFRNGVLFEKPVLQGGLVNRADSSTLFDYLNPGTVLNATTN